jgi:hypothetical protein
MRTSQKDFWLGAPVGLHEKIIDGEEAKTAMPLMGVHYSPLPMQGQ